MSLAEILVRTREVGYRCAERWTHRSLAQRARASREGHPGELATSLVLGARVEQREQLLSQFPDLAAKWRDQASQNARQLLDGTVHLLGRDCPIGDSSNWQQDPLSDHVFENTFYHDISLYELPEELDVKYVWEMNRHQFFFTLARNWYFNRCEESAQRLRDWMISWIAQNPVYVGVNWTSALEAAMRVNSWMWSLAGTFDWPGWTDADLTQIRSSLEDHGSYLYRHFSYYSSPYNHLMGEASSLLVLSHWLKNAPPARKWEARSRRTLEQRGIEQFYDDGFCVEQATGYHFYTLGFMSLALLSAERSGQPLSESLRARLQQAFHAGVVFRQPDNRWPWIGDVDTARSMPTLDSDFWNFGGLVGLGGVLFDDSQLCAEGCEGEETFWLTGTAGLRQLADADKMGGTRHCHLPQSGYVRTQINDGEDAKWLLFDAGPVAAGLHADATPSVAHGHADQLAIWYFAGRPLVGDSGMPRYGGDREWVDYFRDAAAHSTITVESRKSPLTAGRLAWSNVVKPESLEACANEELALGSGALVLGPDCRIERHFLLAESSGLWIADVVESSPGEVVRLYWQLQDDHSPSVSGDSILLRDQRIRCYSHDPGEWTISKPEESDPAGWLAQGYGMVSPGCRVCYTTHMSSHRAIVLTHIGMEVADVTFQYIRPGTSLSVSSDERTTTCQEATWTVRTAEDEFMISFVEPTDERWERFPGTLATQAAYCLRNCLQPNNQGEQSVN